MAGSNKILKDGQVLFKAGDQSDGMYLIRRGEVRVFLEQGGKEVALATVGAGGMIGEMALFDGAPRSASVKAVAEAEVTLISQDEFGKLMKQIPKWFVGLMSSLSLRLRQTNERLQKLETGVSAKSLPFQNVTRILNVIMLLWHKDGEKEGKDFILQKQSLEQTLVTVFNEDPQKLRMLFETLVKEKILTTRQNQQKQVVFAMQNRAVLTQLAAFIPAFAKANPKQPYLKDELLQILRCLEGLVAASPYDTVTASLNDLMGQGRKLGMQTDLWEKLIGGFAQCGEEVKLVKTSGGPGLRTTKKDCGVALRHHEVLAALFRAGLA